MNKIKRFGTLALVGIAMLFQACGDDSFKEIESDLLGNPNYSTGVYTATVSISNIKEKAVQTNGLSGYLLGQYTQEPFGTKKANIIAQVVLPSVNPTFGANSQSTENSNNTPEKETVTEAYLYIPYFNPNSSSTNAAYTTDTEYTLDSIYGKSTASFNITVKELKYFLRDIDADLNSQAYYSNLDVSSYLGDTLASVSNYTINKKSITRNQFDNPTTTEDESTQVLDVLAPGIRIPLNKDFFQSKIIDKEGADELANLNVFKEYFRGISITTDNFSEDLMMLLNMANAKIEIVYTYESVVNNETKKYKSRYEMNVSGITVNLFENSGEAITTQSDVANVSRIFLSGGQGYVAELNLFSEAELAEVKQKNLLITDASLYLYVDQSVNYATEPERIIIYNAKTGAVLADYGHDPTGSSTTLAANAILMHLGKLQKESNKGVYYRLRLTNHIINVIKNNAENVPIGIAIASNVKNTSFSSYLNTSDVKKQLPVTSLATPLSTIIYGNSSSIDENKRLLLKINYTKSN